MTLPRSVKARKPGAALVGVIASASDLQRAARLRRLPDFFELRLDALHPISAATQRAFSDLPRPLIITARHPLEGGRKNLSATQRRALLLRFLPEAAFVDVELRAAKSLRAVLEMAAARNVKRIISVHDFRRTPSLRQLQHLARRAEKLSPDIFKIVTRTDRAEDLARLLEFFDRERNRLPLCAMGVGRLGRQSRIALVRRGSLLHYVHLGTAVVLGQFSLSTARSPRFRGR